MNNRFQKSFAIIIALAAGTLLVPHVFGFNDPIEAPPGVATSTILTAGSDGSKNKRIGVGTYNFLERLNIGNGGLFQGAPLAVKNKNSAIFPIPGHTSKVRGIAVQGQYAYLAMDNTGSPNPANNSLRIVDISDPTNLRVVGGSQLIGADAEMTANPQGIAVAGKYAYMIYNISQGGTGSMFRIIDISNPALPVVKGGNILGADCQKVNGSPLKIVMSGNYAFIVFKRVAGGPVATDLIRVIDVSNPERPRFVGKFNDPGDGQCFWTGAVSFSAIPTDIYVLGNQAYVGLDDTASKNLAIINYSDFANPVKWYESEIGGPKAVNAVYAQGRYVYLLYRNAGGTDPAFGIVDITPNPVPIVAGLLSMPHPAFPAQGKNIVVSGRYAFIVAWSNTGNPPVPQADKKEFRVLDIIDPTNPILIGGSDLDTGLTSTSGIPIQIAVSGRYAYLGGYNGLRIVDLTGIEAVSVKTASAEVGNMEVFGNMSVGNTLQLKGGLTVGGPSLLGTTTFWSLRINKSLSVLGGGMKQFVIDHPLYPETMNLRHNVVESPEVKNVYDGETKLNLKGEAIVELPDYFEALNKNFRYQLTSVDGKPAPNLYIAEEISENRFKIAGGNPQGIVHWQVTGIRKDPYIEANPLEVEELKETPGYLYEGYGRSK